jgi:hypothetical protein
MRKIQELKITSNPRVQRLIEHEYTLGCSRCRPNKGCNRRYKGNQSNWKKFRKNQYKL